MKANIECRKCNTVFGIEIDAKEIWQQVNCSCCGHTMSVVANDVTVKDGSLDDNRDKDPNVELAVQRMEEIESGKASSKLDVICWAEGVGEALKKIRDGEFTNNKELIRKGRKDFECCYMFLMGILKSYKKGVSQKVVFINEKGEKVHQGKKAKGKGKTRNNKKSKGK
jgi:hypothetical protein